MTDKIAGLAAEPLTGGAIPLIGPDDPPPFEVANEQGSAPALLICDHAGAAIPRAMGRLGVDETALLRHVALDIGAGEVTRILARRLNMPAVLATYSRLLIDPNRTLNDPTSVVSISDDVVVPGNRNLSPAAVQARAEAFFWPYHREVSRFLDRFQARGAVPALLSIHSFTPVMKGVERPWHLGILWSRDHRLARPLLDIFRADLSLCVGDNEPYTGRGSCGYSTDTHGAGRGIPHVLIEIRQDLIDTRHGAERWAARIGTALERVLAEQAPFGVEIG
jgi:predicted N-formylglutamate amidohydrolase